MTTATLGTLPFKDLLSISKLGPGDVETIFDATRSVKTDRAAYSDLLRGKRLAMIFEKDSLRTRFTFDIGMQDLGGSAVFMDHRDVRLGSRESVKDMARNLERWGPVKGRKVVYVGDGNNTCHSLIHVAALLGTHITVCTPEGYEPNARVVSEAMLMARESGADIQILNDAERGVRDADAVYTDVWASMGQEDEIEERAGIFHDYRVDEELMALAKPDAVFMHCLPAHRGQEVTSGVIDGPQAIVYDIAENRLHVQKAVLALLLGKR